MFDALMDRVNAGERLTRETLAELAESRDILELGMLADALKRRLHGLRVTFLRVAACGFDRSFTEAVPPTAREVRVIGTPPTIEVALTAVDSARAVAGERVVSGFSWQDVARLAGTDGSSPAHILGQLRSAGLDALAELSLDGAGDPSRALEALVAAGYDQVRLTMDSAAGGTDLLVRASDLQERFRCIRAINPLPKSTGAQRPTTGYGDVKMVAIARLAAPNVPTVQVDWLRAGAKLAQVALTFGADDLDDVAPSDESLQGIRRAPLAEVRRNIEAAGFEPTERDGRFAVPA